MTNHDPFFLELDHISCSIDMDEAVRTLQRHATHLKISVHCEMNGVSVMAMPNGNPEHLIRGCNHAWKVGAKTAMYVQ